MENSLGNRQRSSSQTLKLDALWSMLDHNRAVVCGQARTTGRASAAKTTVDSTAEGAPVTQRSATLPASTADAMKRRNFGRPEQGGAPNGSGRLAAGGKSQSGGMLSLPLKTHVIQGFQSSQDATVQSWQLATGSTMWMLGTLSEERVRIRDYQGQELYENPCYTDRRLEILPDLPEHDDKLYPTLAEALHHLKPMPRFLRALAGYSATNGDMVEPGATLEVLDNGAVTTNEAGQSCLKLRPFNNWPRKQTTRLGTLGASILVPLSSPIKITPNIDSNGIELPTLVQLYRGGEINLPVRVRLFDADGQLSKTRGHKFTIHGMTTVHNFVVAVDNKLCKVPVSLSDVSLSLCPMDITSSNQDLMKISSYAVKYVDPDSLPTIGPPNMGFSSGSRIRSRKKRRALSKVKPGTGAAKDPKPAGKPSVAVEEPIKCDSPLAIPRRVRSSSTSNIQQVENAYVTVDQQRPSSPQPPRTRIFSDSTAPQTRGNPRHIEVTPPTTQQIYGGMGKSGSMEFSTSQAPPPPSDISPYATARVLDAQQMNHPNSSSLNQHPEHNHYSQDPVKAAARSAKAMSMPRNFEASRLQAHSGNGADQNVYSTSPKNSSPALMVSPSVEADDAGDYESLESGSSSEDDADFYTQLGRTHRQERQTTRGAKRKCMVEKPWPEILVKFTLIPDTNP